MDLLQLQNGIIRISIAMKLFIYIRSLPILLVLFFANSLCADTATESISDEGMLLKASINNNKNTEWEDYVLTVEITNNSKKPIDWIVSGDGYKKFQIFLYAESGEKVPYSELGKEKVLYGYSAHGSGWVMDVKDTYRQEYPLPDFFEIDGPGKYKVFIGWKNFGFNFRPDEVPPPFYREVEIPNMEFTVYRVGDKVFESKPKPKSNNILLYAIIGLIVGVGTVLLMRKKKTS